MARVFLSYSKLDRELAAYIAAALRRQGLSVWWDQDVTPRENWDRTIEREIAAAERVFVLWTPHSAIQSDWVRIEANYAVNCKPSKLVQVRFDNCEIPMAFSLVQYLDLDRANPEGSAGWPRLLGWLGVEASLAEGEITGSPKPAPAETQVAPRSRRRETGPMAPKSRAAITTGHDPELPALRSRETTPLAPKWRAASAPDHDPDMFRMLILGALISTVSLAILDFVAPAQNWLASVALIAPFMFGLPYVASASRDGGVARRLIFFFLAVPASCALGMLSAVFSYEYLETATGVGRSAGLGLAGFIGAASCFIAGMWLRLLHRNRHSRRLALIGAGILGVAPLPFSPLLPSNQIWPVIAIQLSWQVLFAYFLARMSVPRPVRPASY